MAVVIGSIFAGARVFKPSGVRTIPINRAADAVLEGDLGMPTKLAANLRTVKGVASIVAGAILDVLHQGFRFAEVFEYGFHDFQVRLRGTCRNVVDLAGFSFFKRQRNGPAIVFDKKPIALLHAITVD